ncbi:N-acetyltransferase GCN5 [Halovivax asiaticus JCM 14624]|uniref:N-acetyltransferase GCN5 n=1 Tax=Halovivax asiaticus JCM 14624 TaxID=1227490 RepID=M0BIV8_9EURY|nr:arsenic resistance N-acetyltransferase ArsN2 [Halovivax asiaticus]ELZ10795.1 N-acetyltransferase GCN5 [Halovivax asiaticus JCM 14624]
MSAVSITLQGADASTISRIETLLAENGLPTADVRSNPSHFFLAFDGGDRVGVGGLERYGDAGLLRSLVVEESARGLGYGTAICDALADRARADGVETLYLLTTTAEDFFAARGYEPIDRDAVPEVIRETPEFADLCPASAVCMRRSPET